MLLIVLCGFTPDLLHCSVATIKVMLTKSNYWLDYKDENLLRDKKAAGFVLYFCLVPLLNWDKSNWKLESINKSPVL